MGWRWTARRWAISAFLVFHIAATTIWVSPPCAIRYRLFPTLSYYIVPLGLWQFWAMFAPDPMRDTITLEAEVIDARGLRHSFAFPKLADYTKLQGVFRFRYSKYTANVTVDEFEKARLFAARHVVRSLNLPADSFPLDVHLFYQVKPTPPPGSPPDDGANPTKALLIGTFPFAKPSEVRP